MVTTAGSSRTQTSGLRSAKHILSQSGALFGLFVLPHHDFRENRCGKLPEIQQRTVSSEGKNEYASGL